MGNIEHIDQLETYIEDLGNEIERIKKSSEYLKLIEQFQSEIAKTSVALSQSKDQFKLYQEIMESKLELFETTSKNIESKQQSLEQTQLTIIASLTELKQQQEKNEKEIISSFRNIESKQQSLEQSQLKIIGSLAKLKQQQEKNEKEIISSFKEIIKVVNQNHDVLVGELNRVQEEQESLLKGMSKANKLFFAINAAFSVSVVGILVYLIMK